MSNIQEEPCSVCTGCGWVLSESTDHGDRIERCDNCKRFTTDGLAILHTYECNTCVHKAFKAWKSQLAARSKEMYE